MGPSPTPTTPQSSCCSRAVSDRFTLVYEGMVSLGVTTRLYLPGGMGRRRQCGFVVVSPVKSPRRAIELLLGLGALLLGGQAAAQRATVALDLSGLDGAAYRRLDAAVLESRAVIRLVQEGFAVVGPGGQPDLTIRLLATPGSLFNSAATFSTSSSLVFAFFHCEGG